MYISRRETEDYKETGDGNHQFKGQQRLEQTCVNKKHMGLTKIEAQLSWENKGLYNLIVRIFDSYALRYL
jgi:hypothetical protein